LVRSDHLGYGLWFRVWGLGVGVQKMRAFNGHAGVADALLAAGSDPGSRP